MPGPIELLPSRITEIAHELRSPLGGIEAMICLLEATPLDPDQARIIAALKASVGHLRSIADEVLDGAKPKPRDPDGPMDASAASTGSDAPLGEFLAVFETVCRARAAARGLEFRLTAAAGLQAVTVIEPGLLRQVLENLVDNAFRLTVAGQVTLAIEAGEAGHMRFSLIDSGPGLSSDDAVRLILEGGGMAGRKSGAGIGLSIAGRIVARFGGQLTGGPAPDGAGACFSFLWPVVSTQVQSCLIVDDHPASRLVLKTILAAAGYRCREASGVAEALAGMAEHPTDIVLTDLNMPGAGGMVLIGKIAGLPVPVRPKVLVVSADDVDASHPLHASIDGAIRKPITVRSVLEAIASLGRASAVQAA